MLRTGRDPRAQRFVSAKARVDSKKSPRVFAVYTQARETFHNTLHLHKSTLLRKRIVLVIVLLLVSGSVLLFGLKAPSAHAVQAGPAKTLNFQARLKTASGNLVPDGYYNIEFKLYNVSSAGSALWTETRYDTNGVTAGNDFRVRVVNGYFSVNLGDTDPAVGGTAFPAIDWSQQLWLTMNIGGTTQTATPTYDGEMTPRIAMTAIPLAFTSNNVASGPTSAASTNSNNITVQSGNATGTTSNSGNITIDSGTATGTTGTISLGATNASSLVLGRSGLTTINAGALTVGGNVTIGNGVTNAAPVGYILQATGGSGSNITGAAFTLAGGRGTGTGVGGDIVFQYAPAGSSGSSLNALQTACSISGTNGSLSCPGAGTGSEQFGGGATIHTGVWSLAVGRNASVTGNTSTAIGVDATVTGDFSTAVGNGATVTGNAGIALGKQSSAGGSAIAIGGAASADESITLGGTASTQSSIVIGIAASSTAANQLILGGTGHGGIQQVYLGQGVTAASLNAITLQATGASGTNVSGAALNIAGSRGTGTGAGGDIVFQYAPAGASGATLNTLQTACSISGTNGSLSCPGTGGNTTQRFGYNSSATGGVQILAVGSGATATSDGATAIGANSSATLYGTSLGYNTTSSNQGIAIGSSATSVGGVTIGTGASTGAGTGVLAVGASATATGDAATAFGASSTAALYGTSLGFGTTTVYGSVALGAYATTTAGNQIVVGSNSIPVNDGYFGNGVTNASPSGITLQATGGLGTNIAGGTFTIAGGKGSGTGVGGNIVFKYAPAGGTGATLNTLQTACQISGTNGSLSCPGSGSNSEHFGAGSTAAGSGTIAIGNSASVAGGQDSVAIGNSASVTGSASNNGGIAIGALATALASINDGGIALGVRSTASSQVGIAIGTQTTADTAIAIGHHANTSGAVGGIALGNNVTLGGGNNSYAIGIGDSASSTYLGSIAIGGGATTTATHQLVVGSGFAGTGYVDNGYFGNGVTSAGPVGFTLQATGGSGTNIAGGAFTLAGGKGTGNNVGGNIVFQYAPAGASGATLNTLQTACVISGTNGSLSCPGTGTDSERFGKGTVASNGDTLAVGKGASATAQSSTAIGSGASVTGQNGVSLGWLATADYLSTAIGAQTNATSGTALGYAATSTNGAILAVSGSATNGGAIAIGGTSAYNSIAIGSGATTTAHNQLVIGGNNYGGITDVYIGKGVTDGGPTAVTLQATGGSGTNIAGGAFNLAGGKSTGNANGGNIVFQYSPAGASGASLNALQTACQISGTNGSLSCPGTGTSSERFGAGALAGGNNSVAIGNGAQTTNNSSVAVGFNASAGLDGTALGISTSASTSGTSVGAGANSASYSVAVGQNANTTGNEGTALGFVATAAGQGIALGSNANAGANQFVVNKVTMGYFGNGVTNAAPGGFTLQATGGSGTNIAGASFTLAGGIGTGTGVGGNLVFQTAKAGSSGAGLNSLQTVASLSGTNGAATFQNSANSTTAFQVQNTAGTNILNVDTTNSIVTVAGDLVNKGVKWTARNGIPDQQWTAVTYGNGQYVAVAGNGTNHVATSPDGINWTSRTSTDSITWNSITYGNGIFVAVGQDGTNNEAMTSTDGITWTVRTTPESGNWWHSVTYGKGLFVAVASAGTSNRVMTSPDGVNWTARATTSNGWYSVVYGNGQFVAVSNTAGTGNQVMTSPDGITWTMRTSAVDNTWQAVTYGNGLFVAVSATGSGNRVMTSPDGITWTSRTSGADNDWRGVTYGNGLYVAVSWDGSNRVMTSSDGITWTARVDPTGSNWSGVTYGNGQFVAVSNYGNYAVGLAMTSGKTELSVAPTNNIFQGGTTVYGSTLLKSDTNSATAFQVQNAAGTSYLTADSTNQRISVGSGGPAAGQLYVAGKTLAAFVGSGDNGFQSMVINGNVVIAARTNSLDIYDVSIPASPGTSPVGTVSITPAVAGVVSTGKYAYVTTNSGLYTIDISNIAAPTIVSIVDSSATLRAIQVHGRYLYVTKYNTNTYVYDISNPAKPVNIYSAGLYMYQGSQVVGKYWYGSDPFYDFYAVDVSNPAAPTLAGNFAVGGGGNVVVNGNYAYLCTGIGIRVINITNPASMSLVTTISTSGCNSMVISGRIMYFTDDPGNIQRLDITNPSAPSVIDSYAAGLYAGGGLVVQGRYLYSIDNSRLRVYDIGGSYIQQIEAGSIIATDTTTTNFKVLRDSNIYGSETVGGTLQVNGSTGIGGSLQVGGNLNTTAALNVQNTSGYSVFNVDSTSNTVAVGSTSASALFKPKTDIIINQPEFIVAGDFNKDGKQDFIATARADSRVYVYLGNGDGTFASGVYYATGSTPRHIAVGDFNKDGAPDIAVTYEGSATVVSVLLNNGSGVFGAKTDYTTGTGADSTAIGDFNKDGNLDLAVANGSTNNVSILLGAGNGTFGAKTDYATGPGPSFIATADMDKDGNLDLVTSSGGTDTISLLRGTGSGAFGTNTDYSVGTTPYGIVIRDFNKDGNPDVATADYAGATMSVLLGKGGGLLATKTSYTTGSNPAGIISGDFNKDGNIDLATNNSIAGTVSVFLGSSTGTFGAKTDYTVGAGTTALAGIATADFNKDGNLDLISGNSTSNTISILLNSSLAVTPTVNPVLSIATNNTSDALVISGQGTSQLVRVDGQGNTSIGGNSDIFAPKADQLMNGPVAVAIADFNKDGIPDKAVTYASGLSVYLGKGGNEFAGKIDYATGGGAFAMIAADFNNDGKPDIAIANRYDNNISIYLNRGNGTFATRVSYTTANNPSSIVFADFNLDGNIDIATLGVTGSPNTISVLLGTGSGTFGAKTDFTIGSSPGYNSPTLATADFNKDGAPDLVAANTSNNTVSVLIGNGAGSFAAKVDYATSVEPMAVVVGDFNNDGSPDVATANASNMSILLNSGNGTFGTNTDYSYATGGGPYPESIVAGDFNNDRKMDIVVTNSNNSTIVMFIGTGTGTFGSPTQLVSGTTPKRVVTGDIDGDGDLDLLVSNYGSNALSTYLNKTISNNRLAVSDVAGNLFLGVNTQTDTVKLTPVINSDNTFQIQNATGGSVLNVDTNNATLAVGSVSAGGMFLAKSDYSTGYDATSVVIADVNGDGYKDLITANGGYNNVTIQLNNGSGVFGKAVTYATGTGPVSVAVGDFNNDGKQDIATSNNGSANVSVLLNNGNGTFAAKVDYTTGSNPTSVSAADVNKDGNLDLITANYGSDSVSVLMGSSSGTFSAKVDYSMSARPYAVTTTDINQDGSLDIITANYWGQNISTRLNNGNGTFAAKIDYGTGNIGIPTSIYTADFNKDGYPDVAMNSTNGSYVAVFLNNRNGTYANEVTYNISAAGSGISGGDFNKDGYPDLAVTISSTNLVAILLNNGNGTFAREADFTVGASPSSATVGDLNNDGNTDLAVSNNGVGTVSVLLNSALGVTPLTSPTLSVFNRGTADALQVRGQGTAQILRIDGLGNTTFGGQLSSSSNLFGEAKNYASGTDEKGIATADLNKDGYMDIVTSATYSGDFTVLLNNGDGTYAPKASYGGGLQYGNLVEGDFNGDGNVDFVAYRSSPAGLTFIPGNGDGTLGTRVDFNTGTTYAYVSAGDFNKDGKLDLAVSNTTATAISILLGNGNGTFAAAANYSTAGAPGTSVVADVNNDGYPDVAVTNGGISSFSLFINNGNGTFAAKVDYATASAPTSLAAGDFNKDGYMDITAGNNGAWSQSVFINNRNGTFASKVDYPIRDFVGSAAVADINNDGNLDIISRVNTGIDYQLGTGTGTFGAYNYVANFPTMGSAALMKVYDVDNDGDLDLVFANGSSNNVTVVKNNTYSSNKFSISNSSATGSVLAVGKNGNVILQNSVDSTSAFQIQNATGTSVFNTDTTNSRVAINSISVKMSRPTGLVAGAATSGGSLTTATTYYYKVTAIDGAGGETVPTSEVSSTATSPNLTIPLTWTTVTGATGYRVYRSTTSGTEKYLIAVSNNAFTDNGYYEANATNPPTTSTAYVSTNNSNAALQLAIGGNGTPTGQLYVSGSVPTRPVGKASYNDRRFTDVQVVGRYAYTVDAPNNWGDLRIFDVSNPEVPVEVGVLGLGNWEIASAIAVSGKYAYVINNYNPGHIHTIDISNPSAPVEITSTLMTNNNPTDITIQGQYAYILNDNLSVYDLSNPTSPRLVSTAAAGTNPKSISVQGRYAYVANENSNTIQIFDITNPAIPTSVSTTATGTRPEGVYVAGRYAYVVNYGSNSMKIYDISNPTTPVLMSTLTVGSNPSGIYVQGRTAYITNKDDNGGGVSSTLQAVDITNPSAPVSIGTVPTGGFSNNVFVQGRYAYVTNGWSGGFEIYDMGGTYTQSLEAGGINADTLGVASNASFGAGVNILGGLNVGASIQSTSGIALAGGATIKGSTVFSGGYNILSAPATPTVTPQGTTGATAYSYTITAIGNNGTETNAPTAGSTSTGNATLTGSNFNRVTWGGVTGAVSYHIFRTATAGTPTTTGYIGSTTSTTLDDTGLAGDSSTAPTKNTTAQLTVQGGAVFQNTTNSTTAVQVQNAAGTNILNVDSTNQRVKVGSYGTATAQLYVSGLLAASPSSITNSGLGAFAVRDNYIFAVKGGSNQMIIYDATNPASLVTISTTSVSAPRNVVLAGKYAYLMTNTGIIPVDISNVYAPVVGTTFDTANIYTTALLSGRYLYAGDDTTTTLKIYDIANPAAPVLIGSLGISYGIGGGMALSGKYLLATNGQQHLFVIDVSNPSAPVSVGSVITGQYAGQVAVSGRYAYVGGTNNGMRIVDISNPVSPTIVGTVAGANCGCVAVSGRTAYVSDGAYVGNLYSIDITNPASPTTIGSTPSSYDGGSLQIQGRYLYSLDNGAIAIYDIGGGYIQQLEAGNIKARSLRTGFLNVDYDTKIGGNVNVAGGLQVGADSVINGSLVVAPSINSTAAVQVQNALGGTVLGVNTTNTALTVGSTSTNKLFRPKTTYYPGLTGTAIVTADFNKDGIPDLVTSNYSSDSVSVLIGTGGGAFANKVDYSTGAASGPQYVTVGDFNNDGYPDLAAVNTTNAKMSVFINNGNGTFAAKVDYTTGTNPRAIAAGDFNKDGKLDLAVVNISSNTLSIYIGSGTGTFAAKVDYTTGSAPQGVVVADFNGDTNLDIAVTDRDSDRVSIFNGTGTGTFTAKVDYITGASPGGIAVGDFNKDGAMDITVTNGNTTNVSVLINRGKGSFFDKVDYPAVGNPSCIATGDFNKDGNTDIVACNTYLNTALSVYINKGDGTFNFKDDYTSDSGPASIAVGDFNLDGNADMAALNYYSNTISVFLNSALAVTPTATPTLSLYNAGVNDSFAINGQGTKQQLRVDGQGNTTIGGNTNMFDAKVDYATSGFPRGATFVDVNGDTFLDMIVTNNGTNNGSTMSVFINNGNGTYASKVDYPISTNATAVSFGDFNRDGKNDLVVTGFQSNTISIFMNKGDGTFLPKVDYAAEYAPQAVAVGDFNGDGYADFVTTNNYSTNISVYINNGNGTFASRVNYTAATSADSILAIDVNKDGKLDIVTANFGSDSMSVFLGTGSGTFGAKTDYTTGSQPTSVVAGDFNKDGSPDMAVTNSNSNTMSVFINNGSGAFAAKVDYTTGANPRSVVTADFNRDGILDLITVNNSSSTMSVFLGTGTGTFGTKSDIATASGPYFIAVGDVDNDTDPDLAIANAGANTVSVFRNALISNNKLAVVGADSISTVLAVDKTSGAAVFKNSANTTSALSVRTATGESLVNVDTVNRTLKVGSAETNQLFGSYSTYAVSAAPSSDISGDLNNDGNPDLVVANPGLDNISVLINTGNGTFKPQVNYSTGARPYYAVIGDFNNDGYADIATSNHNDSTISVLINNGDGTFATKVDYVTASTPNNIVMGDFNNDGKLDLATSNYGADNISVFIGSGTGTFAAKVDYADAASSLPNSIAAGDFNRDGVLDLAVTNQGGSSFSVFMGSGSGTFPSRVDYSGLSQPGVIVASDLNNDGAVDLVISNGNSTNIAVSMNNGSGVFGTIVNYDMGQTPASVTVNDFNRDGKPDLAVSVADDLVYIMFGVGDGTFMKKTGFTAGSSLGGLTSADFNKDGSPDIAVINGYTNLVAVLLNRTLGVTPTANPTLSVTNNSTSDALVVNGQGTNRLLRVDGNGSTTIGGNTSTLFESKVDATTGSSPRAVTSLDANKDGSMDYVTANSSSFSVFINNGNGTFATKVDYTTGSTPFGIWSADFNKDGYPDIVTANQGSNTISVFINNGNGTFAAKVDYATASTPMSVTAIDLNKDGSPDIAVGNNGADTVSIFINSGTGTFAAKVDYATASTPRAVIAADVNKDGNPDIITADDGANKVSVLINSGTGTFAAKVDYTTGTQPRSVAAVDVDKDGDLDLVVGNYGDDTVSILLNNGSGVYGTKTDYATGGSPYAVTATDYNKDGITDLATANFNGNSVSVLLGTGTGTFGTKTDYSAGTNPYGLTTADFDKDGDPDLVVVNNSSSTASLLRNTTYSNNKLSVSNARGTASVFGVDKNGSVRLQNTTNTTAALEVLNAAGSSVLTVDTTNGAVIIGGAADATVAPTLTNSAAGTFGSEVGRDGVSSQAVYNGKLYVATSEVNGAAIYRYDGGSAWTLVTDSTVGKIVSGDTANIDNIVLTVYNGRLYAGTQTGTGTNTGAIYTFDGTTWSLVNATRGTFGSDTNVDGVDDFAIYGGKLYMVTQEPNAAGVYRLDGTRLNATLGKGLAEATADIDGGRLIQFNGSLWWGTVTGSTTARMYKYDGNTFTLMTPTAGTIAGVASNIDISSMAVFNGQLYVGVSNTNAAFIAVYKGGDVSPAAPGDDWIKTTDATSGKIVSGDTANIDSIPSMRVYNGRLYAATDTGSATNTGAIYEFTGMAVLNNSNGWALVNATRGTFGSQTNIDRVSSLQEFNGSLYIGTDDGSTNNIGSIYSFTKTSSNSYALKFASDTANANLGSISFVGTQQAVGNTTNTGSFQFSHGISTTTGAYDLAEDYPTRDDSLVAGNIVVLDQNERTFVKKSDGTTYDNKAVGVYSTNPALRLSQADATINGARAVPIALAGRVPVKVTNENGAIKTGDYITTSSKAGYGMKATSYGQVIGKAMEDFDGADGSVMVFLNVTQYQPSISDMLASAASVTSLTVSGTLTAQKVVVEEINISGNLVVNGDSDLQFVRIHKDLEIGGKLISTGDQPTIAVDSILVSLQGQEYNPVATITGTDVAGVIKLVTGTSTQTDMKLKIKFNKKYTAAPSVVISALGRDSATTGAYIDSIDGEYVTIAFVNAPQNNKTYQFNYQIIQSIATAPTPVVTQTAPTAN